MAKSVKKLATVTDRILIYLNDFKSFADELDGPMELTQVGIAEAVGIKRGNVARAAEPLHEMGYVEIKKIHIAGIKLKRNIYFLSTVGRQIVRNLRDEILKKKISVVDFQENKQKMTIDEVLKTAPFNLRLIELIREANEDSEFNYAAYLYGKESPDSKIPEELVKYTDLEHFHGRDNETQLITKWLDSSQTPVLIIKGMPGIGKTTLAAKVLCQANNFNVSYLKIHPWSTLRSIITYLSESLKEFDDHELKGYLDQNVNIELSEIEYILSKKQRDIKLVMIYDDYHNAKSEIIQFFTMLYHNHWDGMKLVIIGRTVEPFYDRRDVAINKQVLELNIQGLDDDDAASLARDVGLDEGDIASILSRAGGHPLFIELMARGNFSSAGNDIERFIVEEFLSSLSRSELDLMKYLSVYRFPVHRSVIRSNQPALNSLIGKSILKSSPGDFILIHDLIKNSLYRQLSKKEQIKYHSKAAEHYLESSSFDSQMEALYHLLNSYMIDDALEILLSKGDDFFKTGKPDVLIRIIATLMSQGTALTRPKKAKLFFIQAELLTQVGEWDTAMEHFHRVIDTINDSDIEMELRSKLGIAKIYLNRNDYSGSQKLLEQILEQSSDYPDINSEASYNLGSISERLGDVSGASKHFNTSLKFAEMTGNHQHLAEANYGLGRIHHMKSEYDKSLKSKRKAMDIALRIGDGHTVAKILTSIGWTQYELGDSEGSISSQTQAIELARKCGAVRFLAYALSNAGAAYLDKPDLIKSFEYLNESLEIFEKLGEKRMIATVKLNLAINLLLKNKKSESEVYFKSCVEAFEIINDKNKLMNAYFKYAQTHKKIKKSVEARDLYEKALELSKDIGDGSAHEQIMLELKNS